jgi:hypothetical protein
MKTTKKIQDHIDNPKNLVKVDGDYTHQFVHDLPSLRTKIHIFFNMENEGEVILTEANYELMDEVQERGVVDLFFQLIQGRATESLDRVTNKEFDYFLRDDLKIGVFEFYDTKFYEILGIGEAILKFLNPKDDGPEPLMKNTAIDRFFTISFSEQIEYFEELLSRYVYGHGHYSTLEIEFDDIEDGVVVVSISKTANGLEELLEKAVELEFGIQKIKFNYLS